MKKKEVQRSSHVEPKEKDEKVWLCVKRVSFLSVIFKLKRHH